MPLWVPSVAHKTPNLVGCVQVRQKELRELGVEKLRDLLDGDGNLREWESRSPLPAPNSTKQAYEKLTINIDFNKGRIANSRDKVKIFFCELNDGERGTIWEFKVTRGQVRPRYTPKAAIGKLVKAYIAMLGILMKHNLSTSSGYFVLKGVITSLPQKVASGGMHSPS